MSKTYLFHLIRVKHNIRGQKPLSYPFTQIILFNFHVCTLETLNQYDVTPLGDVLTFGASLEEESGEHWGS
jgi:hypothetical protein